MEATTKTKYTLHTADSRGKANHGWPNSHHTFSFANYYNPERMHFGVLRVLNDDEVQPGMGFGTHPHNDMEIISIPLEGDLRHRDSMGTDGIIKQGDIQVMSAGTGIQHSEMNANRDQLVKFLQIWIFPREKGVAPRYDQVTMAPSAREGQFQQVLSPNAEDEGVWIHQDAWFHLGTFEVGAQTAYRVKKEGNGIYAFIINGSATIDGQELGHRDGLGIEGAEEIAVTSHTDGTEVLLMEVPMQ